MSEKEKNCACPKASVGGQALIEGIMMMGPGGAAVSVRTPDGSIDTEMVPVKHLRDKIKFLGWPIIRGIVNYVESMTFGYKCLMMSAEKSGLEDLEESDENSSKLDKWLNDHINKKVMGVITAIASVLGIGLAFLLFFYLPTISVKFLNGLLDGAIENFKALFEGIIRMCIYVLYIALVSLMKDIKRTFMYHGAEHKTIFCYENGLELTVDNVKKHTRFHPRCGTSFIILSLLVSILVYTIVPINPAEWWGIESTILAALARVAIKLLLLPVVVGIAYELIRIAGRHNNIITKIFSAPGLWMQRLTTREPDDKQIEIAIAAITPVLPKEGEDDRW